MPGVARTSRSEMSGCRRHKKHRGNVPLLAKRRRTLSDTPRLDIFVNQLSVGHFISDECTSSAGRHAYEPYRGEGHAILSNAIRKGEAIYAWMPDGKSRRTFVIDDESLDVNRSEGRWQLHILRFGQ